MVIKQDKRSCKYDVGMVCITQKECTHPSLVSCLAHNLYLSEKELSLIRQHRNLRHDQASMKWRNSSFYFKKRCKFLEAWIRGNGLKVPTAKKLFDTNISQGELEEGSKDGLCNHDKEKEQTTGGIPLPIPNGNSGDIQSGSSVQPT